jgi:hypothetical protein
LTYFQAALALLKIVSYLVNKMALSEGMKMQLANELIAIESRLAKTKDIVKRTDAMSDAEIDRELGK